MTPLPLLLACAAATLTTALARAEPAPAAAAPAAAASSPIGPATRQWLDLQRSGAQAGTAHPVPGEVATLAYRRYLDSLRAPATPTPTPASVEPARSR